VHFDEQVQGVFCGPCIAEPPSLQQDNNFYTLEGFNGDSLPISHLYNSLKEFDILTDSSNVLLPTTTNENTFVLDYMEIINQGGLIQVKQIKVADIIDTLQCTMKCSFVEKDSNRGVHKRTFSTSTSPLPSITIAPNPFNDHLTLDVISEFDDRYIIEMFDALNRSISVYRLDAKVGQNQFIINTPDLISGAYLIKVTNSSGTSTIFRMIHISNK
jgi:Secretion system C-terminal sorting domain